MAIRATRIEIFGFGRASGQRDNWKHLSVQVQRMLNRMWQVWLCHHSENGSANLIRAHLDNYKQWQQADKKTRGDKPKWPVQACDKELSNRIYHAIIDEFQDVNARTRNLLQNKWQGTLTSRKAASGSLPGWVAILFANESVPSFTKPQPIPFDTANGKLEEKDSKQILTVRIERLCASEKSRKPSLVETCELMTNKRKAASIRKVIGRCISGEYTWKGSSIVCDNRGKWFACISYEMPQKDTKTLHAGRTLYLIPGKRAPWLLMTIDENGRRDRWRFGGNGRHVEYARRTIIRERASRSQHYRWAGSNQKGHGRNRADAVWTKLSSRWKDFVKRYNHEITRRIVNLCEERGIGNVVYCQPRDEQRDKTFLSRAGNSNHGKMTWDWFQVGTMLASKCEETGIEFRKNGDGVPRVRKPDAPKPARRAGKKAAGVS